MYIPFTITKRNLTARDIAAAFISLKEFLSIKPFNRRSKETVFSEKELYSMKLNAEKAKSNKLGNMAFCVTAKEYTE
jgi:hypothetical protein